MSGLIASRRVHPGRKSIILDPVNPTEFRSLNFTYCCEQCVHLDGDENICTFGHDFNIHSRKAQLRSYELSGKMAFCRFLEID
ncbi:MAG: hypothetical protein IPL83_20345 [Bdellovibrionales bacterium]|jgi:hypothetical protein|nr:hypothetical protein [Bdellovibrionales bacterium]MBK9041474.1 hypothetical protein [Bdellovibrionales bacterium]